MYSDSNFKAPSQRQLRVGEQIRHVISDYFIRGEFYEPELFGVSVTVSEVKVSPDLKKATAYVSVLDGNVPDNFIELLDSYSHDVRKQINKQIRMKFSPQIKFKMDDVYENANKIESILSSIKEESEE